MKTKLWNRLSLRLIISITIILTCILAVYTYILVTNLDEYLTNNSFKHAYNISEVIKKSTRYSMLLNRREDVHQIINTIGTEEDVKGIRIYNKQGTIIFSTDSLELNKKVNVTAEACIVCHNASIPLITLSNQDKIRIFTASNNQRVLGLINPINNEEDCSSADCHAHSPKIQFLGVLDVMVSMKELDAIKAETTRTTIINSIIITILIAATCGFFIVILVNVPMRKLSKGMEELGNGNLDYRISVDSKDELGKMAKRFNEMSSKLDAAYTEIKDWSENLNKKVNEKTEELKNIYNQVNQIEKLASLGKLSATVAHELNNPLEGILTYSKLISKKLKASNGNGENTSLIKFLDLISDETARCGKIVKDLLIFSHKEEEIFTQENLISLIDKSITIIDHHLEMHNISLVKEYHADGIIIQCDAQKIQQALIALFINAIEAMHSPGKITVQTAVENKSALIRIKDEGTGISPKDLPHIFEPFFSTKEAAQGTGLGLAVTYGIVISHGGKIIVEETSPKGTTFKIELPLNSKGN
ncbi:MAG TPA: HAMP domain-containing sensor histidine kinase [Ignavibacteriaceae bacterium]|nr:HAMP domain-containing sensor histidine kinase [Ignavibacteriaceae bacterium]